jgi:hypothetical protein
MFVRSPFVVGFLAFALSGSPCAYAEEQPVESGLTERVDVREVQILVTVWPEEADASACPALTADDFRVEVRGREVPVKAAVRYAPIVRRYGVPIDVKTDEPPPLQLVVLIDEFHHSCPACLRQERYLDLYSKPIEMPIGRHRTYELAREMVREAMRPGDRVMIATLHLWPRVHTPWLEDADEALAVLDQLEQQPLWVQWHFGKAHVDNWYPGMLGFVRALGRYPGVKDVFFPTCHFPLDAESGEEIGELSATAAVNDVVLHTVNIFLQSREIVGPLAANLGGRRFGASQKLGRAVEQVREVAGCRFLISFEPEHVRDHAMGNRVVVTVSRPGFDVTAPTAFHAPGRETTARQTQQDLFQLDSLEQRIAARVSLLPVSPMKDGRAWRARAFVHVKPLGNVAAEERPERLVIDAMTWKRTSEDPFMARITVQGEQLERLFASRSGAVYALPFEAWSGETYMTAIVHDARARPEFASVVREQLGWPTEERAREHGFVLPAHRIATAEKGQLLTSLDRTWQDPDDTLLLAYSCEPAREDRPPDAYARLASDGRDPVSLKVISSWQPPRTWRARTGCRWVLLAPEEPLAPGTWALPDGPAFVLDPLAR